MSLFWLHYKGYFQLKMEKVSITIEFCIFELGTKFQLKLTFLILASNLLKKNISSLKQKNYTLSMRPWFLLQ